MDRRNRHTGSIQLLVAIIGLTINGWTVLRAHDAPVSLATAKPKPNIILILVDDLGYGDVQCLNPSNGKIATPNRDRLAGQGMVCTEAQASWAVCDPRR